MDRWASRRVFRDWFSALWLAAVLGGMAACGGSGSGNDTAAAPPPVTVGELKLQASNLADGAVAVPTDHAIILNFNAEIAAEAIADHVQITDSQQSVPLVLDILAGSWRVRPAQGFRLRESHTLTIKSGLKARNGAVLSADVVRRFKTVLFDGYNEVVQPGNVALRNYRGTPTFRIADVNGDGRPDIVQIGGDAALAYETDSYAINIFTQRADGAFGRTQNLLVRDSTTNNGNEMGEMAVVDLDQDGLPEILVSVLRRLPGQNGLTVLKQNAQGQYAPADFLPTDAAYRLLPADLDSDGHQDVLVIGQGRAMTDGPNRCGMVAVLSSPSGPLLQPTTALPCERYEAVLGHLDGSQPLHLVLLRQTTSGLPEPLGDRLKVYRLDGRGQAVLDTTLTAAAAGMGAEFKVCQGLMLMDANGDQRQDLFFRSCLLDDINTVSVVYTRVADGAYTEWGRQGFGGYAYLVGDMDRDGLDDVMVVRQNAYEGSFVGGGLSKRGGGFELTHLAPVTVFDTMSQESTAMADLNGDGLPDIVMDSYNTGLSVFIQGPRPRWFQPMAQAGATQGVLADAALAGPAGLSVAAPTAARNRDHHVTAGVQ